MNINGKSTRMAVALAAGLMALAGRPATAATDFSGYWTADRPSPALTTLDGKLPPLKAEALAQYRRNIAARAKGDVSFDSAAKCVSPGVPRLLTMPYPFEIVQSGAKVLILYGWNRIYRLIGLGVPMPEADYPYKVGVSNARWQGDALVVDTTTIDATTLLDSQGMPHSEDLKLTEQYSLGADGKSLSILVTIDDPRTFTHAWQTRLNFHRMPADYILPEDICLDRTDAGQPAIAWPAG